MYLDDNDYISISDGYIPLQLIRGKNGCCPELPALLTISRANVYSVQCTCGGWCTSGFKNPDDAIDQWRRMCRGENCFGVLI